MSAPYSLLPLLPLLPVITQMSEEPEEWVKSRKFCTFLHASSLADEDHQRLLVKDRQQLRHIEILPPTLPFLTLLRA